MSSDSFNRIRDKAEAADKARIEALHVSIKELTERAEKAEQLLQESTVFLLQQEKRLDDAQKRAEKAEEKLQRVHEWLVDNEAVHQLDIDLDALWDIMSD